LKAGADDYVTKPFDMLELNARVEALLRRTPARKSTQLAEHSGAALAADQDSLVYHSTFRNSELRAEPHKRVNAQKDSPLVEVAPQLRKMLDEEQCNPQTPRNSAFLKVAEGVIQFLEEILEDVRTPRRRR
jgi:response regulator RpfG family c-di-GMP phosphodiesterase